MKVSLKRMTLRNFRTSKWPLRMSKTILTMTLKLIDACQLSRLFLKSKLTKRRIRINWFSRLRSRWAKQALLSINLFLRFFSMISQLQAVFRTSIQFKNSLNLVTLYNNFRLNSVISNLQARRWTKKYLNDHLASQWRLIFKMPGRLLNIPY